MAAIPLLAAPLVKELNASIAQRVVKLREHGVAPKLAIVDATGDEASACYARMKMRQAAKLGIETSFYGINPNSEDNRASLLELLGDLGRDDKVHGIFIERPMPRELELSDWLNYLPPQKDVEGVHPINIGKLFLGLQHEQASFMPTTALACVEMLKYYRVPLAGKHAVVIGRSATVGRPLAWMLLKENATVTICHSHTSNLRLHTQEADILISATGQIDLIDDSYINPKCAVIDVGTSYREDGTVCGDVDYERVVRKARMLTPHIGGLGPVTTVLLMRNAVQAAEMAWEWMRAPARRP